MDSQISVAGIEKFFYYIKKIFTNRYIRSNTLFRLLYQGSQSIFSKKIKESLFATCMPPYLFDILGFYKTKGVKIAFIIDAWESSIEYIAENIDLADIILIAYQDSIHFLRKHLSQEKMKKVFLFPNFINPKAYPVKSAKKIYDMIQVGRRNNILHKWAIKYSRKKGYSYLFQKRNQRGMYYLEDGCAATQNMLVAAHAHGLGACWVAGDKKPYAETVLQEVVKAPKGYQLVSLVSVGYVVKVPDPSKRKLADVLHWEQF